MDKKIRYEKLPESSNFHLPKSIVTMNYHECLRVDNIIHLGDLLYWRVDIIYQGDFPLPNQFSIRASHL